MKAVTAAQMRALDQRTIEEFGTPGSTLMERAGRGIAQEIKQLAKQLPTPHPFILFLAGKGNNGGDAWVAARYLHQVGYRCEVWLAGTAATLQGDALNAFEQADSAGVLWRQLAKEEDWSADAVDWPLADVLVDGLLGTGTSGPPRGVVASAIRAIQHAQNDSMVVALDLPSGLHADTGEATTPCIVADLTLTLGAPKQGLLQAIAWPHTGSQRVIPIGIPEDYFTDLGLEGLDVVPAPTLPRRRPDSHKGTYGRVACLGGTPGYTGAIALAGQTALVGGSGLVSIYTTEEAAPVVAGHCREYMVQGDLFNEPDLRGFDALLCGPGLGQSVHAAQLVNQLIERPPCPLVLDADALNLLAGQAERLRSVSTCILSPHPAELARLLDTTVEVVQADREGAVRAAAESTGAVVVLKGAGTLVALADGTLAINLTGNPGMATGGTGDVLSGLLVSLLGQGLPAWDAARAAVYLHGCAGDHAAWRKGERGMTAGDVAGALEG